MAAPPRALHPFLRAAVRLRREGHYRRGMADERAAILRLVDNLASELRAQVRRASGTVRLELVASEFAATMIGALIEGREAE